MQCYKKYKPPLKHLDMNTHWPKALTTTAATRTQDEELYHASETGSRWRDLSSSSPKDHNPLRFKIDSPLFQHLGNEGR